VLVFSPCQRPKGSWGEFCDLCSECIASDKYYAYCTYLVVCVMMGGKLRYIIQISINGKCRRKMGALVELFYRINAVFTIREYTYAVLLGWEGGGEFIHT